MMIDTTKLHFGISLGDLGLLSRSELYEKAETSTLIFSQIFQLIQMKFSMVLQPVGLLKLGLNLLHTIPDQRRELCQGGYELISFRLN